MANGLFAGGDGTELSPYLIEDAHDLNAIRNNLNAHYKLINDIDLNVTPYNEGEGWDPVVNFRGILNGDGYKIKNLYTNKSINNVGLIGTMISGIVMNLGLLDVNVQGSTSTGGLVGNLRYGTIKSCFVTGSVKGQNQVGGLVGTHVGSNASSRPVITMCYTNCNVDGNTHVGGMLGYADYSNVLYSYAVGKVTYVNTSWSGGFAGYLNYANTSNFFDVETTGTDLAIGNAKGISTEEMKSPQTFISDGWDTHISDEGTPQWILKEGNYPEIWFEKSRSEINNHDISITRLWGDNKDNVNIKFNVMDDEGKDIIYKILLNDEEYIYEQNPVSTPTTIECLIKFEHLQEGDNLVSIIVYNSANRVTKFEYLLIVENRDTFIFERILDFEEEKFILSENSQIKYGEGLSLKSVGYGSLEIPIPTEGKAKVKQVLIDDGIELQPVIPIMTSNNQDGFVISSSSSSSSSTYLPWKAFQDKFGSSDRWLTGGNLPQWIQIELPNIYNVFEYGIYGSYSTIADLKSWEFQGSYDGSIWDTLDIRENEPQPVTGVEVRYIPKLYGNYKFYRLIITDKYGTYAYASLGRWQLYTDKKLVKEEIIEVENNVYKQYDGYTIYNTMLNNNYRTIVGLRG